MHPKTNNLLIISRDAAAYNRLIQTHHLPNLRIAAATHSVTKALEYAGACHIIFGDPHLVSQLLPTAGNLHWVQSTWAGVTPLLGVNPCQPILITGIKGAYGPLMREYVLAYMLMHERRILIRYEHQRHHRWHAETPGALKGKYIGLLGVGSIGSDVARGAKALDMRTHGFTRNSHSCKYIDRYFHGDQLIEFVAGLDYLVCLLPETPATTGLIDRTLLSAMRPGAVLINAGRGNTIDQDALVWALNTGRISSAVLDVFQQEPLPAEHIFWETPNMIITSHTAAMSIPEDIANIFIDNYNRLINGAPLVGLIDVARGY